MTKIIYYHQPREGGPYVTITRAALNLSVQVQPLQPWPSVPSWHQMHIFTIYYHVHISKASILIFLV